MPASHDVVRIGVVGAGLVANAVHLPLLAELPGFELAALADPSPSAREAASRRHRIPHALADHRALLGLPDIDAVLVCSPNGTHARVTLDALASGRHVLVEKPLCLDPADADRVVAAAEAAGRVVQVGCMKRYDPAYEALLADLHSGGELLHIASATFDPWLAPSFMPADAPLASDVPAAERMALARATAAQVAAAANDDDPAHVHVYSDVFLGALVHDVNLVRGVLDRLGLPAPRVLDAAWAVRGAVATAVLGLPGDVRWTLAWMLIPGLEDFEQKLTVYARDAVRSLLFPAPYLLQSPTVYARSTGTAGGNVTRTSRSWSEAYRRQLEHFHACVTEGETCRTPAGQGRDDVALLAEIFRTAVRAGVAA